MQVTNGSSGGQIALSNDSNESENPRIFSDADNLGFATAATGGGELEFYTAGSKHMRISDVGNVYFGTDNNWFTASGRKILRVHGGTGGSFLVLDTSGSGDFYIGSENSGLVNFWNQANEDMVFGTNNTERVRIDSSGKVGIGTSSPANSIDIQTSTNSRVRATDGTRSLYSGVWSSQPRVESFGGSLQIEAGGAYDITFDTNSTERMRINSSGNVGIGQSSPTSKLVVSNNGDEGFEIDPVGVNGQVRLFSYDRNSGGAGSYISSIWYGTAWDFYDGSAAAYRMRINSSGAVCVGITNTTIGSGNVIVNEGVYVGAANGNNQIRSSSAGGGSATLYIGNAAIQVSSDRRLKENIVDTSMSALEKLDQVRVVDFTWNDPSDTAVNNRNARGVWTGIIAQELVDVFPFAVNAPRNEDDLSIDEQSESTWHVNQDQLVPVLIKAIQELKAEVAALKGA